MPQTKLGTYLENRVNLFLKRKDAGAGDVTIRVLSSSEKVVEVRPGMKSKFCTPGPDGAKPEMADSFPYLAKAIFAFEEIDGVDVCFFGMHVQEFGSNCPAPNARYDTSQMGLIFCRKSCIFSQFVRSGIYISLFFFGFAIVFSVLTLVFG